MNFRILALIFTLILSFSVKATTWTSNKHGYWNSASTWLNGIAPSAVSSDTFIIKHCINIQDNLEFNNGSHVTIESLGGICGHYKMTVGPSAVVHKYGMIQMDSMLVVSSQVYCYGPGDVILVSYARVTGAGAQVTQTGGKFVVGQWFDCGRPGYQFVSIDDEQFEMSDISVFPNPNNGSFNINLPKSLSKARITISDLTGRIVLDQEMMNSTEPLNVNAFGSGIYILSVSDDQKHYWIEKVLVE